MGERDEYFGPPYQSVVDVLVKLGIDPRSRTFEGDQDAEYTACRAGEVERYFDLYTHGDLALAERDVLCCFLLQGLDDVIRRGEAHPLQAAIFDALFDAEDTHRAELAYWMDTSEPDPANWFPIKAALIAHKRKRSLR